MVTPHLSSPLRLPVDQIKPGLIENSYEEMAIIVNYDVEEILTLESGETKSQKKEKAKKKCATPLPLRPAFVPARPCSAP